MLRAECLILVQLLQYLLCCYASNPVSSLEDFDNCENAQIKILIEKCPNVLTTLDKKCLNFCAEN